MFDLKEKMRVMHCSGVEGPSLYINNFRVCGPKPWGGGSVVKEWKDAETGDILRALGNNYLQAVNSHEALVEACKAAHMFIKNGIDFGFIRMPDDDCPDPAKDVPGIVAAALAMAGVKP